MCVLVYRLFKHYGIGVLYGKKAYLEQVEPIEFGGEMIDYVVDGSYVFPGSFEYHFGTFTRYIG